MEKKYPKVLAGCYLNPLSLRSGVIDDMMFDNLQYVQKGGKLQLRFRTSWKGWRLDDAEFQELTAITRSLREFYARMTEKDLAANPASKHPVHAFLEFVSAEEVEQDRKLGKQKSRAAYQSAQGGSDDVI